MKGKNEEARVHLGILLLCFQSPGQNGESTGCRTGRTVCGSRVPFYRSLGCAAAELL